MPGPYRDCGPGADTDYPHLAVILAGREANQKDVHDGIRPSLDYGKFGVITGRWIRPRWENNENYKTSSISNR